MLKQVQHDIFIFIFIFILHNITRHSELVFESNFKDAEINSA